MKHLAAAALLVASMNMNMNMNAMADEPTQLTAEQHDAACKRAIPKGLVFKDCSYEDRLAAAQVKMAKVVADSYRQQYDDYLAQEKMIVASHGSLTDQCAKVALLKTLSLQMKDADKYSMWSNTSKMIHCEL